MNPLEHADQLFWIGRKDASTDFKLPPDHKPGMKVPHGGANCAKCEYFDGEKSCTNKDFINWNGSAIIPGDPEAYCSDWFEAE